MEINKLVRDNIPKIFEGEGKTCVTRELELEEYAEELIKVLDEEMLAFKSAFNNEEDELAVKKIADTVEVLYAVLDLVGVEQNSFEKIRLANKQKFGGYEKKILLESIKQNDTND